MSEISMHIQKFNSIEKSDSTAIKKVASNDLTAVMLNKKFWWEFKEFIVQGKFYEDIKGKLA